MKNRQRAESGVRSRKGTAFLAGMGAVLFWILIWWGASRIKGKPLLFPSPWAVLRKWTELLGQKDFWITIAVSFRNVLSGILSALFCGILLAFATDKFRIARRLLLPLMTVIKATPVASFIILLLIWVGASQVPSVITFLIVLPVVWTNLDVGLSKVDRQLAELVSVYRIPWYRKLRLLTVPSVMPYFVSASRTALGLAWKAGIAAEVIAMPLTSIGTRIGTAKLYLETEEMFAWTLTVVLLSLLIEYGMVALLNLIPTFKEGENSDAQT